MKRRLCCTSHLYSTSNYFWCECQNIKLYKNRSSSFKYEIRGGHKNPYQLCEKKQSVTLKPSFFYDFTLHNLVGCSWKFRDKLSGPSSWLPTKVGKQLLTYAALISQKCEGLYYAVAEAWNLFMLHRYASLIQKIQSHVALK